MYTKVAALGDSKASFQWLSKIRLSAFSKPWSNVAVSLIQVLASQESQDKDTKPVYPKIKISNIPVDSLTKLDKSSLRNAIFEKNPAIAKKG